MSDSTTCDPLALAIEGITTEGDPHRLALGTCAFFAGLTFVVSTATGNYSQVDKLWSIIPVLYTWMAVCDARTLLMACLVTVWGIRLTWNFHRRGGYKWPPWNGDEDYRWEVIRKGGFVNVLTNPTVWIGFNLGFISVYQNLLLLLIATPSLVAWTMANSSDCRDEKAPLNMMGLDGIATTFFLFFVMVEAVADNQQYAFQTEKYRRRSAGEKLTGEYAAGFCQTGLFSVLRKPNYASEQAIWITFYLFSVAAMNGKLRNWSGIGFVLLVMLFQVSGWFTESITLKKYPKYAEYQNRVPLYIPFLFPMVQSLCGRRVKSEKQS